MSKGLVHEPVSEAIKSLCKEIQAFPSLESFHLGGNKKIATSDYLPKVIRSILAMDK